MKRHILRLFAAAAIISLAGCSRDGVDDGLQTEDGVPEGYVAVEVDLRVRGASQYATRATDHIMDVIDNVNLFWFKDTGPSGIDDDDPVTERRYFEYGTRQKIYLKKDEVYYVYAIANLEDSHCPNGNLSTYFDDVETLGDLKRKYILNDDRATSDLTKVVMAAKEVAELSLVETPGIETKLSPKIDLDRVFAKFIINIYNKVNPVTREILSHVNPVSMNGIKFIRGSYIMPRNEDFDATSGYTGNVFYQPRSVNLTATGDEEIVRYPANSDNFYTKQTFEIFTFENRQGTVGEINGSGTNGNPDVFNRKEKAPDDATHLRITSIIGQDAPAEHASNSGKVLYTWVHAGKGRQPETNFPDKVDNFDVDRNTVYHFNIVINGIDNVEVDTRRQYLDQMVLFELTNAADRVDAHYVDLPAIISGNAQGIVKMEAGTATIQNDVVSNWEPMEGKSAEDVWLRFSMYEPDHRFTNTHGSVPVTWYTPGASTSLYVDMPTGGLSRRRLMLHFDENVSWESGTGAVPCTTNATTGVPIANNPPYRTAVIRFGFIEDVHTAAEYDAAIAGGDDVKYFYQSVDQYGLKTVGAVGGYQAGQGYTRLLGVESVEETQTLYYTAAGLAPPPPYDAVSQVEWRYRNGTAGNTNQSYDGLTATRALYNDYRGNSVPPQRGQNNISPASGYYNPFTNTNAADYCMRKNRDENGDGIISGDEVKWYLPTPVQLSQIFQWKAAFQYPLNQTYTPFGGNYWTTNDSDASNAYVSTFAGTVNTTITQAKTTRSAVRCVRDIEDAEMANMFYYSSDGNNGYLVANLTGFLPNLSSRAGHDNDETWLINPVNNTVSPMFIISRWYTSTQTGDNGRANPPRLVNCNGDICGNYREDGISGKWFPPSERELALIYAYAEMLNNILADQFQPNPPARPGNLETFHYFILDAKHWGFTNIGSNNSYWFIDFATGASDQQHKNTSNAYMRCVRYLTPAELALYPPPKTEPEPLE